MTRTFTVYWNDEDLRKLNFERARLERDADERRPHISRESFLAMRRRLDVLKAAVELMVEVVPE